MAKINTALSIAGSDPSGGAGIQADLKTFHQHRVYGMTAITLITVQNTQGVQDVVLLDPTLVVRQISAVLDDIPPNAIKTGALGSSAIIKAISSILTNIKIPIIVDPVMISKHGAKLLSDEAIGDFKNYILPLSYLITPNINEAELLAEMKIHSIEEMKTAAQIISSLGAKNVLIKGGHLDTSTATDVLFSNNQFFIFESTRIDTKNTHGTGCTLSAAITAQLATGLNLIDAIKSSKEFITTAIKTSIPLGKGIGPVNHFAKI
jgi:hydroxymethylpyrimidine/phosphomethylpyrimidine kinase